MRLFALLLAGAALGACGKVSELEPAPGHALPPKPLLAKVTPTADELLDTPPSARPERVDEIVKRSQPRKADRFDLPPAGGAMAPPPPAQPTSPADPEQPPQ